MSKSLDNAIKKIQAYAESLEDIQAAPAAPIESLSVYPYCVTYPATGTLKPEAVAAERDIHTIYSEIHINPVLIAEAVPLAIRLLKDFGALLKASPTLDGTVDSIIYPIRYTFGRLEWSNETHIGFRFEIDLKLRNVL